MAESPLSLEAPPGSFRWPISSVCWVLLIAGLLFFPVAYKEYRYAFSACVFLTLLIAWHDQGVYLHPALLASLVGVMLLGLFLIIYDRVWLQNSSGFMEISFWIGNPLIYTLFILGNRSPC
jgi:vacuolar-type H+-ATPase subunit I/STV1